MKFRTVDHNRRKSFYARLSLLVSLALIVPMSAWATMVYPDSGAVDLAYSYPGSITDTDCSNPARGAGYYGDLYKTSSSTPVKIYLRKAPSAIRFCK